MIDAAPEPMMANRPKPYGQNTSPVGRTDIYNARAKAGRHQKQTKKKRNTWDCVCVYCDTLIA